MMRRPRSLSRAVAFIGIMFLMVLPPGIASDARKRNRTVTFNKDVAPIFFASCAECHRAGGIAPMSLLSYKEARPWARSIREMVLTRQMPPWHADPNYSQFANDRRLTDREIDTIVAWIDSGAGEGEARDLPPAPRFSEGWRIGKPDLVLSMPEEITLSASGNDEYYYIELPYDFTEDRYVQMAELIPSNRKVAHHITAFLIPPIPGFGAGVQLSREAMENIRAQMEKGSIFYYEGNLSRTKPNAPVYDDGCVLESGGSATSWNGAGPNWTSLATPLVVYSPGADPVIFPQGMAKKLPARSRIMLQAHYWKPEGKIEKDRVSLGLTFAKTPPVKEVRTQLLINNYFKIPPGADHHRVTACWTADRDLEVISFMPHMHWRGKSMTLEAIRPGRRSEVLLNVPSYRFQWQTTYLLKKPLALARGVRLMVTSYFDNTAKNKYNPDPTLAVRAGEPTRDEMMACFVDYAIPVSAK